MAAGTKLGYADGFSTAGLKFAGTGAKSGAYASLGAAEVDITFDSTLVTRGELPSSTTLQPSFIRMRCSSAWWLSEINTGTAAADTTSRIPVDADTWEDIPFQACKGSFSIMSQGDSNVTVFYKIYYNGV